MFLIWKHLKMIYLWDVGVQEWNMGLFWKHSICIVVYNAGRSEILCKKFWEEEKAVWPVIPDSRSYSNPACLHFHSAFNPFLFQKKTGVLLNAFILLPATGSSGNLFHMFLSLRFKIKETCLTSLQHFCMSSASITACCPLLFPEMVSFLFFFFF